MKKKDINLFEVLMNEKKPQGLHSKKVQIGIITAIMLVNVFVVGLSVFLNDSKKKDISEVQAFLADEMVANILKIDRELNYRIATAQLNIPICEATKAYLATTSGFEKSIYEKILEAKPENVTIQALSYRDGILQISSFTADDNPPADYTKALEETGLFDLVTYRGFVSDINGGRLVFPITCTMKAGADK